TRHIRHAPISRLSCRYKDNFEPAHGTAKLRRRNRIVNRIRFLNRDEILGPLQFEIASHIQRPISRSATHDPYPISAQDGRHQIR
ncbi:hypothetical protein FQN51_001493, partial [Onygenales sp. PD_10]